MRDVTAALGESRDDWQQTVQQRMNGTPSKGLMDTIRSTFGAHQHPHGTEL
ncbi:hypothetical protein [Streptomyces sp. NPDC055886]